MRVLFCCRPAYGHVHPLLPLATACRDAGHEVIVATGEGFAERLRRFGFRARRVGIAIGEAEGRVLRARPELGDLPRDERWRFGVAVFGDVLARAPSTTCARCWTRRHRASWSTTRPTWARPWPPPSGGCRW